MQNQIEKEKKGTDTRLNIRVSESFRKEYLSFVPRYRKSWGREATATAVIEHLLRLGMMSAERELSSSVIPELHQTPAEFAREYVFRALDLGLSQMGSSDRSFLSLVSSQAAA